MQNSVELLSNGLILRGMLHTPTHMYKSVPIVCLFHGFTGNKMEPHFMFVKLSRMLEEYGIASVRFDFGNSGESDGDFSDMTLSGELYDADNILDYAKGLSFVDPDRVGVIGLSMGGLVSTLLAKQRPNDIKAMCLWAPAGNMREFANTLDTGLLKKKGFLDMDGLKLGNGFFIDIDKMDLMQGVDEYNNDVLIIHGNKDEAVPLEVGMQYHKLYGNNSTIKVIECGDHTFNSLVLEEEVLEATASFFTSILK